MGKKVIVIGGGPAGYTAAIRAAQLGADVTLAEASSIGGVCLNSGCVPAKSLLRMAAIYRCAAENAVPGIDFADVKLDWPAAQNNKNETIKRLAKGVGTLLRRSGVKVYNERAYPLSGLCAKIGGETVPADAVILATGSVNSPLDIVGADLPGVIDSTGALSLDHIPCSIVIVGGGVIGIEFASLFSSLGSKISIVEFTSSLLPFMDEDISEYIQASLESDGVSVYTNARLIDIKQSCDGYTAGLRIGEKTSALSASTILIAVGRKPHIADLGFENFGLKIAHGAISTDEFFRTSIPGLYAVGDCNGKSMLAHAAMAQGETAAEHIMNTGARINNKIIPSCVYTAPEAASVGLTEKQARDSRIEYSVGRFNLSGNGRAVIESSDGFVKIISDKKLGEVLGVHMVCPNATELIAEAALCMSMEGTVEDITSTIHAHPTVSESLREAGMIIRY